MKSHRTAGVIDSFLQSFVFLSCDPSIYSIEIDSSASIVADPLNPRAALPAVPASEKLMQVFLQCDDCFPHSRESEWKDF